MLECGCGTGAQTILLATRNPAARIVSLDRSPDSVRLARSRVETAGIRNVQFQAADLFQLPFEDESFDHVFVCFVLEHLRQPLEALQHIRRVLRAGGSITAIEGDHGSWYCHPQTAEASRAVDCLVELQGRMGGDALIGRRVYPLLAAAGYRDIEVTPQMVYVDDSRPDLVEGFSKNTFIAMVEGVRPQAIAAGLIDPAAWDKGIADLYRAAEPGGTFCYTFFKGVARR